MYELITIIGIILALRFWWKGYKELDEQLRLKDEARSEEECCAEQE